MTALAFHGRCFVVVGRVSVWRETHPVNVEAAHEAMLAMGKGN